MGCAPIRPILVGNIKLNCLLSIAPLLMAYSYAGVFGFSASEEKYDFLQCLSNLCVLENQYFVLEMFFKCPGIVLWQTWMNLAIYNYSWTEKFISWVKLEDYSSRQSLLIYPIILFCQFFSATTFVLYFQSRLSHNQLYISVHHKK